ncbi:MAG: hypothetical protein J6P87_06910 [Lachnospiraceae bacterium]|nr:hypothetical protein [Lachnospiraceae bacterium]
MDRLKGLKFIFVHGLSGWGSYDDTYRRMPYWGMRGGDLMAFLRDKGYDCYAASVAPRGSAWDRACELYAQIAGCRTDYGRAHSEKYGHERYGRDFSSCPLIPEFNDKTRLVLLGHSFGGATVRLFASLLAEGDKEEQAYGNEDLSPLFRGGLGERVHSIVTLAAPTNGTTSYDMFRDPSFDIDKVKIPLWSRILVRMMSAGTTPVRDSRDPRDYADHDMRIDNAAALNERIGMIPSAYYFAVPCSSTKRLEKKGSGSAVYYPVRSKTEPLYFARGVQMGVYKGKTEGGRIIEETWRENDGLVNTLSAAAPFGAPSKPLDRQDIRPGIWNVFPVYNGDHMSLQGGLMIRNDIRGFYSDLLEMLSSLP